jgi:outer membrane protein assembly factor BamD
MVRNKFLMVAVVALGVLALGGCRHRYQTPIAKETDQPDKVLFDRAIKELEKNKYESARLLLQTLINTYDSSEYLAKAKLAVADSWFQQGDAAGLANAEAEYKDFILFYPTMEEAAEAQEKVCKMQYRQMEKPDRDAAHALRAEQECKTLLTQFPNSKFAPEAEQILRNIQESMARGEYKVGTFYARKGSHFPAANRLETLVDNYPNFSQADDALWFAAEEYKVMGDRWEKQNVALLTKLVRDYPLSPHVDPAKQRLTALKAPVPEPDPVAYARMKFELENREKIGLWSKFWGAFATMPNLKTAAKSGPPQMEGMRPTIPANVPVEARGVLPASGEVTISAPADPSILETAPDARSVPPASQPANGDPAAPAR